MNLTCVIVDDEYLAIEVLQQYVSQTDQLTVQQVFINAREALTYLSEHRTDILFLDIQMPYLSGFDLLHKLKEPPLVIFTTAHHDYAVQAFELEVLDYLVKPFSLERFHKSVQRATEYLDYCREKGQDSPDPTGYIMIRADYRVHKIMLDQIEYLEGLSEYVKIFTTDQMYITYAAMKDLLIQLPENEFFRVHKSFIIAKRYIRSFTHQKVFLTNEKVIPIGRAYKAGFLEAMA